MALKCELRAPGNTSEIDPSVHGESSNELSISVAKDINVNVTQKTIAAASKLQLYSRGCVLEDGATKNSRIHHIRDLLPENAGANRESAYVYNESGYPLQITPTVSVDDESASDAFPTASGWLKKLNPRGTKWTERLFCVEGLALKYFKNKYAMEAGKPLGIIDLTRRDIRLSFGSRKFSKPGEFPLDFEIYGYRTYVFVARDPDVKLTMLKAIVESMRMAKKLHQADESFLITFQALPTSMTLLFARDNEMV